MFHDEPADLGARQQMCILALIGLGYAARRVHFVFQHQRRKKRFLDEMPDEADISLLLAARYRRLSFSYRMSLEARRQIDANAC